MTSLLEKFVNKYGRLPTEFDKDYLELLNMSKYRILDTPDTPPGKCANCGASKNDGRKYVDFGLQVDWYGTVHLCGSCLKDIAQTVGLFEDLRKELAKVDRENEKLKNLHEKGVELHDIVIKTAQELEDFYVSVHTVGSDSGTNDNSSVELDESVNKPGIDSSKSRTTKPATVTGRKNVRSLTDLLNSAD